jgi:hypothetical protein
MKNKCERWRDSIPYCNNSGRYLSRPLSPPAKPTGSVSGTFVTETFEDDGGRQVTVYVPPNPPEGDPGQEIQRRSRTGDPGQTKLPLITRG